MRLNFTKLVIIIVDTCLTHKLKLSHYYTILFCNRKLLLIKFDIVSYPLMKDIGNSLNKFAVFCVIRTETHIIFKIRAVIFLKVIESSV